MSEPTTEPRASGNHLGIRIDHLTRTVILRDPVEDSTTSITADLHVENLYGDASDIAAFFASFPADATVAGFTEEWPDISIAWDAPASAEDIATRQAEVAAQRQLEADLAEFEAWREAKASTEAGSTSLAFLALLVTIVAAGCVGGAWLWVHVAEAGGWLRACVALGLVAVFPVGMWRSKVAADRYDQREAMRRIGGGS